MKISISPNSLSLSSSSPSSSSTTTTSSCSSTTTTATTTEKTTVPQRCFGLDLLVKAAVYHVAGSVIGVPYIQRRVIRRRKPAIRFNPIIISTQIQEQLAHDHDVDGDDELIVVGKVNQQSVKLKDRCRRKRSIKN